MTRPTGVCDERAKALKQLTKYSGSLDDSLHQALGCHRADADQATREEAVGLLLRRVERLCRDILDGVARLPR